MSIDYKAECERKAEELDKAIKEIYRKDTIIALLADKVKLLEYELNIERYSYKKAKEDCERMVDAYNKLLLKNI